MYRQIAVPGDQRRRQILDADARAAGHDDDVGVGMQGLDDRRAFVAHQAGEVDDAAVALDERRQHRPIGVGDMKAAWRRARGQQLVPGHRQTHAGAADHLRLGMADGAENTNILRSQLPSRLEQRRAAHDIFATPTDMLSRGHRGQRGDRERMRVAGLSIDPFGRQDGVGAARHRRAGHDADGLSGGNGTAKRTPRHRLADDAERQPVVRARPFRADSHHGVAVHRRAIEPGHVDGADDGCREHAARRIPQRHALGAERLELRIQPGESGVDRVPVREAAHPHIVGCSSGGMIHGSRSRICYVTGLRAPFRSSLRRCTGR